MDVVRLKSGCEMPMLGFGVFQVDDLNVCEQSVCDAIEAGYRLFDTAMTYKTKKPLVKPYVTREYAARIFLSLQRCGYLMQAMTRR
jgi:diketogulonate reductase-like aldo/keto reductase